MLQLVYVTCDCSSATAVVLLNLKGFLHSLSFCFVFLTLTHKSLMFFSLTSGTTPSSPFSSHPESPTFPSCSSTWSDECTICYENVVDTVLYACGHMCLCYACGLKLKKMANACCPICRRTIKDIIKTYRST